MRAADRVVVQGHSLTSELGLYCGRCPGSLGKEVDPKSGVLGARLDLDPTDLLTHGLLVGMTGSGKTGLAIALIEETLKQGCRR